MAWESDIVTQELVEIDLNGRKFMYQPTTAGQENEWLKEYMVRDEAGNLTQDLAKLNELKVRNLAEVPYDAGTIARALGLDNPKEWKDLNQDARWRFMKTLRPGILGELIQRINRIDNPAEDDAAKN